LALCLWLIIVGIVFDSSTTVWFLELTLGPDYDSLIIHA
jgi:hypothetical protein